MQCICLTQATIWTACARSQCRRHAGRLTKHTHTHTHITTSAFVSSTKCSLASFPLFKLDALPPPPALPQHMRANGDRDLTHHEICKTRPAHRPGPPSCLAAFGVYKSDSIMVVFGSFVWGVLIFLLFGCILSRKSHNSFDRLHTNVNGSADDGGMCVSYRC